MKEPKPLQYPFCRQMTGCQVFLVPFDLNEVANRLYARW